MQQFHAKRSPQTQRARKGEMEMIHEMEFGGLPRRLASRQQPRSGAEKEGTEWNGVEPATIETGKPAAH
jgi:hypothetical protein